MNLKLIHLEELKQYFDGLEDIKFEGIKSTQIKPNFGKAKLLRIDIKMQDDDFTPAEVEAKIVQNFKETFLNDYLIPQDGYTQEDIEAIVKHFDFNIEEPEEETSDEEHIQDFWDSRGVKNEPNEWRY